MTTSQHKKQSGSSDVPRRRVALIGFGTVGAAVAELLTAGAVEGLELVQIYNRDVERKRNSPAGARLPAMVQWTEDAQDVLQGDADMVVEAVGGLEPMEAWLQQAMRRGKHVVTANKQLIAYRADALLSTAAEAGVALLFNAAVAGGVPVIPAMLHGLQGDTVNRVAGILNGTCNFMLSHMEAGAEYTDVLAQAQAAGYAEADPTADVDGLDARAKLAILARIAMRAAVDPDQIAVQSIRSIRAIDFQYARELNCTLRQVAQMRVDGDDLRARVAPMLVPRTSPFAWSHGTQNMVVSSGAFGGDVVLSGHGAGGKPTAVAMVSDMVTIARGGTTLAPPVRARTVTGEFNAPHYLRFVVRDKPGIVSAISGALAAEGVNIDSILQRPGYPKDNLPFVVTTEPCLTSTVMRAVDAIAAMPSMLEPPLCLQMLVEEDRAED